ncbi:transposase [Actinoallomurus acaciae]|uniref:Transposase n=1 Tax=Actinoallomurus acaciae TaxID=502577 RepID=A0ABV5Y719_9ACTN
MHAELRDDFGVPVGRKRVARLMRTAGLEGVHRRRRRGRDDGEGDDPAGVICASRTRLATARRHDGGDQDPEHVRNAR